MNEDPGFGLYHAGHGLHPRPACLAYGQAGRGLRQAGDPRTNSGPRPREDGIGEGSWSAAACLESVIFFYLVVFSLSFFSLLTFFLFFNIKIFL
jgi:hypothetical protein